MSVMVQGAGTMILLPQFKTHDVLQALSKHRATLFPGVPSMFVALNNSPEFPTVDLTSLRHCFSGAAPLPQEVQERFEAHIGGRLVEGYGMTEANACIITPLRGARGREASASPSQTLRPESSMLRRACEPCRQAKSVSWWCNVHSNYTAIGAKRTTLLRCCGMGGFIPAISPVWMKTGFSTSWIVRRK